MTTTNNQTGTGRVGALPTTIEGYRDTEIRPGVWLITDPTFVPAAGKWRALANVGGVLAVVELKVYIKTESEDKPNG